MYNRRAVGVIMEAWIWALKNWRIIGFLLMAVGTFAAGWVNGSDSVRREWEVDIHTRTKAALATAVENQKRLAALEETKNANLKEVDRLRANNHALWLRLPKTPCPGSVSDTTSGSIGIAGSGELPEGSPGSAEQAINRFDRTFADEAYRADKVVEDCRVVVDWAKSLHP